MYNNKSVYTPSVLSHKYIGIKHSSENCDLVRFQTRKLRTRKEIAEAYDKLHDTAKELLKVYLRLSHSRKNTDDGWVHEKQAYIAACLAANLGRDSFSARSVRRINTVLHAAGFLITVTSVDRVGDRLTGSIKVKPCVSKHFYYSVILKKKLNNFIDCDLDSSGLLCDYIGDRQYSSNSPSFLFIKNRVKDKVISLFGEDLEIQGKLSSVSQGGSEGASMTLKRGVVCKPKGKFVCYCQCGGCIFKNKGSNNGYFYGCSFNFAEGKKKCYFKVSEERLNEYFEDLNNGKDFKGIAEMINFYAKNEGELPLKLMPLPDAVQLPAGEKPAVQQPAKTQFSLGSCRCGQPLFVVNKGLICSNYFFGCRMSGAVEYSAEAHDGSRISIGACKCRGELFIENMQISCSNAEYGCDRAKSAGASKARKPYIYMGPGRRCCRECGLELTADRTKFGSFLRCQNQCITSLQQVASYVQGICQGNVRICPGQKPHCETHNGECGSFLMSNLTFNNNGRYDYINYEQLGNRDRELVHKWAEKLRAARIQKPKFEKVCCRVMKRICLGCPKFPERKEDEYDVAPSIDNGCCLTLTNHKALEKELCYIAKPTVEGVCCKDCEKFMVECEQKYGMAYDCLQRHLEFVEKEHTGTLSDDDKWFDRFVPSLVWQTGRRFSRFMSEEERAKLPDLDNINVVLKICKMGEHYVSDKSHPISPDILADLERITKKYAKLDKCDTTIDNE